MRRPWLMLLAFVFAAPAGAQNVPPRFDDLPKLAKTWPPAWAALVADIVPAKEPGSQAGAWEREVQAKLDALLKSETPSKDAYRRADLILVATLRHHQSLRRPAPLADNPSHAVEAELQDRLAHLRQDWLAHLASSGDLAEAVARADSWLPVTAPDSPLRAAVLQFWLEQAQTALARPDYPTARTWLNRIDEHFDEPAGAPIRKPLHDRAAMLLKEAQGLPDAPAVRALTEALQFWPRLPEARDALERRKGTYRTLTIGVRSLPEQLSPATAETVVEKQALELLFDRLYHAEPHKRYAPQLAAALPGPSISLRRDVYWSNGACVTAADVRHTALLMNPALWREFLDGPRLESNPFLVNINYRQGLLDPLAPLTFHVLPQLVRGKQLDRADDPEFAKSPVGSGPYQYVGRKVDVGKVYAVFQANPCDLRGEPRSLREIRMVAWSDPQKDLAKPLPQMILDAPTDQLKTLQKLGYTEVRLGANAETYFLAVNHRKPGLASVAVRRAMAHAIDRQALLQRHFRGDTKDKYHASANSLFPRGSWASCPAPRVPEELYQPDQAKLFAKKSPPLPSGGEGPGVRGKLTWTLKYPAEDARVAAACKEITQAIGNLFEAAKLSIDVQPVPLSSRDLRKALHDRDFDLLYTSAEDLDDPVRLALLFDTHETATRRGGGNYLGYDNDIRLQELLAAALKHRQFAAAQTNMHAVDAHLYETMPAIPLWQLELHVLVQPTLRLPAGDGRSVFASISAWKP